MKYNKRLSLILGILFAAILFCMADNVWDIPTEQNKETKHTCIDSTHLTCDGNCECDSLGCNENK